MVGLPLSLGVNVTPSRAFTQVAGDSIRIKADVFSAGNREAARSCEGVANLHAGIDHTDLARNGVQTAFILFTRGRRAGC